jgi:hypothetical protein
VTTAELRKPSTHRGVRVSTAHRIMLEAAERAGVAFRVNDGQRTIAIQQQRVRDHGVWSPRNPHGAALPQPGAPHIKRGAANHALDVDMLSPRGGHLALAAFYRRHGVPVAFNVPTEGWHADPTDEAALLRAARELVVPPDPLAEYPAEERRWIREYDRLKSRTVIHDEHRLRVLRVTMTVRRKAIWQAARRSGWDKLNRRARYASLLARTRGA